jgi:hypothetical protein
VGASHGHVGSSVPAAPQVTSILASSDGSAGDVPEQRSKRKKGQRKRKLDNIKMGRCLPLDILFFLIFLLHIFLNYISNAISKVPHTLPPTSLPTHSQFFGPGVPLYWGIYSLCVQWASLSSDGRLGHLLIHMQLESRARGYWLVHNVVPSIGLQIPLAPWVLSLAPPLGAL